MASVFLCHVVGDLTVGKPELVEFLETETVESAIRAIGESTESGIPVWKEKSQVGVAETVETRQQRFVCILNSLDLVAFFARDESLADQEKAMKTSVSQVIVSNNSLLREVDPGTRLIDALEMMKRGVKRLLVPKSTVWKGTSKRFSVLYNGKWLNNNRQNLPEASSTGIAITSIQNKFCCLTREDVIRFLIGCLGALAPIPLSSISSLGAINPIYRFILSSQSPLQTLENRPDEPCAIAVVEPISENQHRIIGDISSSRLWKYDYIVMARALASRSAGDFVSGIENCCSSSGSFCSLPGMECVEKEKESNLEGGEKENKKEGKIRRRFGSGGSFGVGRGVYGGSWALSCKDTSSLAAVMAQMLSHRATHVWVNNEEDVLVGVVGFADVLSAVTKKLPVAAPVSGSKMSEF